MPLTPPQAEIFSQGDEVVTGTIVDTNAAWLSRELRDLGFEISRHTAVGDRLETLTAVLQEIAGRADLCISTGGLGPTSDDLTAAAVARAFGRPLTFDPEALRQIEAWFGGRGRPMPAVNRKQAYLPQGAQRLDNLWGTAPGFGVTADRCHFVFLPGVPGEMQAMFRHWVAPTLPARYALRPPRRVVLHCVGIGESALQERLDHLELPDAVSLGFHAGGPENRVKLLFPGDFPSTEQERIVARAAAAIGGAVYAIHDGRDLDRALEDVVGQALSARKARLLVLESASGGALCRRCAGNDWFSGGQVATLPLGPAGEAIAGEVLAPAVTAHYCRNGDYVLAQTGRFSRADLVDQDVQIELELALAGPSGTRSEIQRLAGSLARKQEMAAALSLDFIRRSLADPAF